MVTFVRRGISAAILAIVAAALVLSCKSEAPTPAPETTPPRPSPASAAITPVAQSTTPSSPTTTPAAQPTSPSVASPEAQISPEAEQVFQEMDRAFANSTAREVSVRARCELKSSTQNFRGQVGVEMVLQFPNRMDVRIRNVTESNDPETTTTWHPSELNWGILSDGSQMLVKKGFTITQKAPATLDDVLDQQIELVAWGESPIVNCFLKTRPSTAFKTADLVGARVVQRTAERIDLELTTKVPKSVRERAGIPEAYCIVQQVTIEARSMIPRRCYMDLLELRREYHRIHNENDIKVAVNNYEIIVAKVNLNADFSGAKDLFVIPKEATSPKPSSSYQSPLMEGRTTGPLQLQPSRLSPSTPATTGPIGP